MAQVQRYFEDHFELDGTTLRIRPGALSSSGLVPDTRAILTTSPGLTGGGNLSADRTLSLAFTATLPAALGAAATGSSGYPSRSDHVHPAPTSFTALQINKLGIGREAASLPVNGVGIEKDGVIAFRNVADSAWLGALDMSSDELIVGGSGNDGTTINAGGSFAIEFQISGTERAHVSSSAFVINNDFPLQMRDFSSAAQDILKLRTDDILEIGGTTSGIEGIRLNADPTNGVAFRVSGTNYLLVDSAGHTSWNAIPFRGRNTSGTPLNLAVISGGNVAVFGNTSINTEIAGSTAVSLLSGALNVDSSGAWLFNTKSLRGLTTGSALKNLASIDGSDVIQISDAAQNTRLAGLAIAIDAATGQTINFQINATTVWQITSSGVLAAQGGNRAIQNVLDPVNAQDAATKIFVETTAQSIVQTLSARVSTDPTTTTSTASPPTVALLTISVTTSASTKLVIHANVTVSNTSANQLMYFTIDVDGTIYERAAVYKTTTGTQGNVALSAVVEGLSPGSHTVKLYWATNGGTAQIRPNNTNYEHANMIVQEVRA